MIEGMMMGINTAFSGYNILMVMMGCFAGTIIGMLPGLGPMSAIALMIPITYGFDPASAMILMAGVYYGAIFGGSTSSILINAPGVAGTVSSSFDGYPMSQRPSRKGACYCGLCFIFWRHNCCIIFIGSRSSIS